MPRTTIAAVLAMLLLLAPAASARPMDAGYPAYPTPEVTPQPKVMPERVTDHPAPKADVGKLVREQESTSGSGNQGVARPAPDVVAPADRALAQERAYSTYGAPAPAEPAPAPVAATDDTPWPLIGAGMAGTALLLGLSVLLVARARRPRVAT